MSINSSASIVSLMVYLPMAIKLALGVLGIYALILLIKALKIYIGKNEI